MKSNVPFLAQEKMLNSDFENQTQADLDKIFDEQVITQAIPFEEYFNNTLRNIRWDEKRTLLARINRYKEFCLQPFSTSVLDEYLEHDITGSLDRMDLDNQYRTVNDFLRDFGFFAFKPKYVAFFNVKHTEGILLNEDFIKNFKHLKP